MTYRPLGGLTTWSIALSIVAYAMIVAMSACDLAGFLIVPTWTDPDVFSEEPLHVALFAGMILAGLGAMVMGLTAGIVFLVWFSTANANVPALGVSGKKTGPGWAVGWWFIPFANLVMPFLALKETYVGSKPGVAEVDRGRDNTPAVVGWWWAVFLIGGFLTNIEGPLASVSDPAVATAAIYLGVFTTVLMGVSLWLYIRWTLDIHRMQEAKHNAGGSGLYACAHCGYDLRGTTGMICPECGARVPEGHRVMRERERAAATGEAGSLPEPWE